MLKVKKCKLPAQSFLNEYERINGCFTDCYTTEINGSVSFEHYIATFYTTPLFKLERFLLKLAISKASTDKQAEQLANAEINKFSAWSVENRNSSQLLMCDLSNRTRSWFMIEKVDKGDLFQTRLYFGSAVAPVANSKEGKPTLGFLFKALLGFHKLYSIALLYSVRLQLEQQFRR